MCLCLWGAAARRVRGREIEACLQYGRKDFAEGLRARGVVIRRPVGGLDRPMRLVQIAAAGELHLQRVNALRGLPIVPDRPATSETPVRDAGEGGAIAYVLDHTGEGEIAARPVMGANVEMG